MSIIKHIFLTLVTSYSTISLPAQQKTEYKFSFGSKEVPGYIKVEPSRVYSAETSYGFDFGTSPVAVDRKGKKPLTSGFCTSDNPFFFSVALPEGNYNIKIITGNPEERSVTTARAESRRLIFEKAVANHAESGLSLGSFLSSNRFKKVLSIEKPGDYLFIEFGHNDQKEKGPDDGAYKSYSERMRYFVNEFRKKGGIPVIVSPANRRSFGEDGKITNSLGDYPEAARKVSVELKVPFIDLNGMTKTLYESLGVENSKKMFVIYAENSFPGEPKALNDNTHFNSYGAYQLAKCIIKGIRYNNLGIKKYLLKGLPIYNPSKPDPFEEFSLPISPHSPVIVPPSL